MEAIEKKKELARRCRLDILNMTSKKKAGFIGSDFSCIDIIISLYEDFINREKDTFILSKGHAAAAWYTVLVHEGFIEESCLQDYNTSGKNMGVHPKRGSLPEIKTSTGSLGQGMGLASGIALGDRLAKTGGRVYVIVGDGEMNEGSNWEILLFAAKQKLDNMFVIIDRNHLQSYGRDEDVLNIEDFENKFNDFGWDTHVIDGHDFTQIGNAVKVSMSRKGKPHAIIAETVKGKGVKVFENEVIWHYKFPDGEIYEHALEELKV